MWIVLSIGAPQLQASRNIVSSTPPLVAKGGAAPLRVVWRTPVLRARQCLGSLLSGSAKARCLSWSRREWAGPTYDTQTDAIYVGSSDKRLRQLSPSRGDILATATLPGALLAKPVPRGRCLLAGLENGELVCLDRQTLAILWRAQLDTDVTEPPVAWGSLLYVVTGDSSLYAIDAQSGRVVWRQRRPIDQLVLRPQSHPLVLPGLSEVERPLVLVGNRVCAVEAYDAKEGMLVLTLPIDQQSTQLSDVVAGPVIADKCVVAASFSGGLRAWKRQGFDECWSVAEAGLTHVTFNKNSGLLVAGGSGKVIALDARSGQIRWRVSLGIGSATNLVLRGGNVYTATSDGGILVLDGQTGKPRQWLLAHSEFVAPVEDAGEALYALSTAGTLYRLGPTTADHRI
ncbi:MAG: PQQ-binding-like beta-propeller repeat protein [Myxococcota bacterium]